MKRKNYFPPEIKILPLNFNARTPFMASGYAREGEAGGNISFLDEDNYNL